MRELLLQSENLGRGKRFRKLHWEEGSFWHVVDAKIVEAPDTADVAESEHNSIIKRVSGVRFRNDMPQTGRVSSIRDAGKRGWVPVGAA